MGRLEPVGRVVMGATENKRILFLVHSYYLRDTRPRRLASALSRAGWEVDVVCARAAGEPKTQTIGGVRVHRLPARRKRGSKMRYLYEYGSFTLMAFFSVARRAVTRRYAAVYVVGIPNFIVFAAAVPRAMGARVFLDMRDPLPEFFQAKYGLRAGHPLLKLLRIEEKMSARFASEVVTVYPTMAALYERSVPASRVHVIMNTPDPALFAAPIGRSRPEGRTLLYTGKSVSSRYGVDLAVRAVARLRARIPALELRVVGDGEQVPELVRLAHELNVDDHVHFERSVPIDKIPAIVADAWIGVQPNRDDPLMRFSLSQKVLEWCMLGLPVVCGETPPLREIFSDDEVLFHAPGDLEGLCARILEADADPAGLEARAKRARATVERFSYDEQIGKLLELLRAGDGSMSGA